MKTENKAAHTPTQGREEFIEHVKRVLDKPDTNFANDEKELIVRAVNSHEVMLTALEHAAKYLHLQGENGTIAHVIHAAITKAEGK